MRVPACRLSAGCAEQVFAGVNSSAVPAVLMMMTAARAPVVLMMVVPVVLVAIVSSFDFYQGHSRDTRHPLNRQLSGISSIFMILHWPRYALAGEGWGRGWPRRQSPSGPPPPTPPRKGEGRRKDAPRVDSKAIAPPAKERLFRSLHRRLLAGSLGFTEIMRGVDQRDMGQRLREISGLAPRLGIKLLRQ
jgi:hypothetical protein